ncbi:MAG: hypothetical protein OXF05_02780 [Hyphomicrobiales bacterium]|nr:hypothetical protein [Hyphomicrobiales bacterium]
MLVLLLLAGIFIVLLLIMFSASDPKKKRQEEDLLDELKWKNDGKTPEQIAELRRKKESTRKSEDVGKGIFAIIFVGIVVYACSG